MEIPTGDVLMVFTFNYGGSNDYVRGNSLKAVYVGAGLFHIMLSFFTSGIQ
jgi:hypothetical protein